jgi:hypothetical protein
MDFGALEILFTWQTLFLAAIIAVCTTGLKTLIDMVAGGTVKRKKNAFLTRFLLPAIPLILGAVAGAFIPIQPETLLSYASERHVPVWAVGAPWGFIVGIFADYLYSKILKRIKPPAKPAESTGD